MEQVEGLKVLVCNASFISDNNADSSLGQIMSHFSLHPIFDVVIITVSETIIVIAFLFKSH